MTPGERPDVLSLPFNPEVMFTNHKNVRKKGVERRQTKLMQKLACVKPFLKEGEQALLITTGCSPVSLAEQFLTGWIVFTLKRSLFVFTNQRILHIPTTSNFAYRDSIAVIDYADCQSLRLKGRHFVVEYAGGAKETFLYFGGRDAKKLKVLIPTLPLGHSPLARGKRVHLCPRCTKELEDGKFACPSCRLEFKNKEEARRISLIYPGGGYFYTRHPFLGISDAITEFILTILVIVTAVEAFRDRDAIGALVFLVVALAVEKALTVYHSNHFLAEFIPKEKHITRAM